MDETLHVFGHACCESVAALREENARLKAELATESAERIRCRDGWAAATRERDAALTHGPEDMIQALEAAEAEVARLEGLILDWSEARHALYPLLDEAQRIRAAKGE